jgi:hypothetical protein
MSVTEVCKSACTGAVANKADEGGVGSIRPAGEAGVSTVVFKGIKDGLDDVDDDSGAGGQGLEVFDAGGGDVCLDAVLCTCVFGEGTRK